MANFNNKPTALWTYPVLAGLLLLFCIYNFRTWWRYARAKGAPVAVTLEAVNDHSRGPAEVTVRYNGRSYQLPVTQHTLDGLRGNGEPMLYYDARRDRMFDSRLGVGRYAVGAAVSFVLGGLCLYWFFRIRYRRHVEAHRVRRFYS